MLNNNTYFIRLTELNILYTIYFMDRTADAIFKYSKMNKERREAIYQYQGLCGCDNNTQTNNVKYKKLIHLKITIYKR